MRYNNFNKALTSIEKAVAKDPSWTITSRSKYNLILTINAGTREDTHCLIIAYDCTNNRMNLSFSKRYTASWEGAVICNIKDASTLKEYVRRLISISDTGKIFTMIHNINIEKSLGELG